MQHAKIMIFKHLYAKPANDVSFSALYIDAPSKVCSDEQSQSARWSADLCNLTDLAHGSLVLGMVLHAIIRT